MAKVLYSVSHPEKSDPYYYYFRFIFHYIYWLQFHIEKVFFVINLANHLLLCCHE
jgi:hypothetical protein